MKKRKISNFYTGLYVFMSFFFLGGTAFFSWILTKYVPNDPSRPYDFGFFCGVIFIIVDAEGMTTYWRKNTYRLLWTDCVEFEIVQVPVNWSTSAAVVYCSTRVLSQKEKENFFWYHKNDFAHVQYFQYSDEAIFQEFLHCVPERARNYLEAEALVLGLPGE